MESLKKNQTVEAVIEGYTAEGMGVARVNGMAVFVPCTAAGDELLIKIVKANKNYAYGRTEKVLKPSPARIKPGCPAFPKCGGCTFLHINYDEELRLKGQRVEDALRRIGGFDISLDNVTGFSRNGYRNKAQFLTCEDEKGVHFGFYRSRSHQVIPFDSCMIQSDIANRLAAAVCQWMEKYNISTYDEEAHKGLLRRIYVREGKRGSLLCIVANGGGLPHADELAAMAKAAEPSMVGLVLNINREKTNKILGTECVTLWGEGTLKDDLLGLEFDLSPMSFYQVNHDQAENLYSKALEYADLKEDETALDLYCGVGTITLLLAQRCREALGNEIVPEAVENARKNAERNNISNVRFILGDAGQAAGALADEGLHPSVIVCDPPRKGMDEETINAITAMSPQRLVYVSCDPASLARDCKMLAERGFSLVKAEAFDMFPGTAHVETVALLRR